MRRLFSIFGQRWFVTLLGVAALALLIWYVGPLFAFAGVEPLAGTLARQVAIGIVVAIWLADLARRAVLAAVRNARVVDGMGIAVGMAKPTPPSPEEEAAKAELSTLEGGLKDALGTLRKARFGGGVARRMHLYQLPWYVLIGPPGSGKTTLLRNSGLDFPLRDQLGDFKVRGTSGTRNCDWFFTDKAVLLDTAGRYTTQDSHEAVDSAAWEGFLDLLRKHRKRRPVNGAIIAVSVADLMRQDEADRRITARAIRQRVRELHERLGVRFPVYLMFTMCDRIAGFTEFFEDLGREERAQVWGMTFDEATIEDRGSAPAQFPDRFAALTRRLFDRQLERMQQDRDIERRTDVFVFPHQFTALSGIFERFVAEVFEANRYEETPMLRGVYFTSATQEGNPVNRLMDAMGRRFGLGATPARDASVGASPGGRSYFVTRLLDEVVFPEAELAGTNLKLERYLAWAQRGVYAALAVGVVVALSGWFVSYSRNQALVEEFASAADDARDEIAKLDDEAQDPMAVVGALTALRGMPGAGPDDTSPPWLSRLGLYQGERLSAAAERTTRRLLRNQMLPRVVLQAEDRIRVELRSDKPDLDWLYELLRTYLMFAEQSHYDASAVYGLTTVAWDRRYGRTRADAVRTTLDDGLNRLVSDWPSPLPLKLDQALVERARDVLRQRAPRERAYSLLKRDPKASGAAPPIRLGDAIPNLGIVFVRRSGALMNEPVPGLFTLAGYRDGFLPVLGEVVKSMSAESWVLGEQDADLRASVDDLRQQVLDLYMDEYIYTWQSLLDDLEIAPFSSVEQAVDLLILFDGPDSPLTLLMELVRRETKLPTAGLVSSGTLNTAANVAGRVARGAKARAERLFGPGAVSAAASSAAGTLAVGMTAVERHFQRLNDYTETRDGRSNFDEIAERLEALYSLLDSVRMEPNRQRAIREFLSSSASNAVGKLDSSGRRAPAPLNRYVLALTENVRSLAAGSTKESLNAVLGRQVVQTCERRIVSRYPFQRGAGTDVTLRDFAEFFGPGGAMDRFFADYLEPYVDTASTPWQSRAAARGGLRLSPAALAQFERARTIRDTFFPRGEIPATTFTLEPVTMDASIETLRIEVDGQATEYGHGPRRPSRPFRWPGDGVQEARLSVLPPLPGSSSVVVETGAWAWFKLLDRFAMRAADDATLFEVMFDIDGRQAQYRVNADSARNPFQLRELQAFRCPSGL